MAGVMVVIGTRPEGIKLAPVVEALQRRGEIETRVALTGQHSDLMDQVIDVFNLPVQWDLEIMRDGQDLYDVTRECLEGLREVLRQWRPDILLVQGDTASAFVGGLVAFYERTRLGHVEAGLRSGDKWKPYPEEIFRRLTGVLTDVHFAPTPLAATHLLKEGVDPATVHVTGNTVVDALLRMTGRPHEARNAALAQALESGRRLVLVTAHRRESFGAPLRQAFMALRDIADACDDVMIIYPVHPNPNVRGPASEILDSHDRIVLTEPFDYLDLVHALQHAALVITDSGGIQEEAPTFGVPVLVMREVTERPEGVHAGVSRLVGTDRRLIADGALAVLQPSQAASQAGAPRLSVPTQPAARGAGREGQRLVDRPNPYGDGHAAERIADIVIHTLTGAPRRTQDWPGLT